MKIKKFIASSMQEALNQIKLEFGEDAIILNSKNIEDKNHPEWKNAVEVTAAIDKKEDSTKSAFNSTMKQAVSQKAEAVGIPTTQLNLMQKDLDFITDKLDFLINHIKYENLPHIPKLLQQKVRSLITNGVDQAKANTMIEEIFMNLKGEDLLEEDLIIEKLIGKIRNCFQITGPVKFNPHLPTVVMLIGPTGVGKTTTLAKLAAMYKFNYSKKVALVSLDSFRIAAMEQLKAFADIAKISFVPIYNNNDLMEKMETLKKYDLILMDSAGINSKNMKQMIALKELIRVSKADEIYLTLSVTTKYQDLKEIIKNFSIIPITGLIYTKLDETTVYGDILNIASDYEKPISYVTFGQNIPEDISLADRKELAVTILRGKYGTL